MRELEISRRVPTIGETFQTDSGRGTSPTRIFSVPIILHRIIESERIYVGFRRTEVIARRLEEKRSTATAIINRLHVYNSRFKNSPSLSIQPWPFLTSAATDADAYIRTIENAETEDCIFLLMVAAERHVFPDVGFGCSRASAHIRDKRVNFGANNEHERTR